MGEPNTANLVGNCLGPNGRREAKRLAFPQLPLPVQPVISGGLSFDQLCVHNVVLRCNRKKVFILAEAPVEPGPMSIPTIALKLQRAFGPISNMTWYASGTGDWFEAVQIVQELRKFHADALVVIGRNAIIDLAKVVLYAHSKLFETTPGNMEVLMRPTDVEMSNSKGKQLDRDEPGNVPPLFFVCIPTTCGGAPYTPRAYGYNKAAEQYCTLVRNINYPQLIIMDGVATIGTSAKEWVGQGVEGINHVVEGILSIHANPTMTATLTNALRRLCTGLILGRGHPYNIFARNMVLQGVNLAMTPMASVPPVSLGASHAFCNAAQQLCLAKPGEMAAVILPIVLAWSLKVVRIQSELHAFQRMRGTHHHIAEVLWETPACRQVFERARLDRRRCFIGQLLRTIFDFLGMPSTLPELGIASAADQDLLAMEALKEPCALTAPVRMTRLNHSRLILHQVSCLRRSANAPRQ
ncbi:hypothetical protein IWZ03DRAFT_427069 [Phyllosticta citriasiana]|uniref:Fe-containing alcohol dehydrogenase-like C-terminal domain-containing protein n=1 Tax=Phyllosticta citriasiana TaxID=595635 RepID=A0ABR1K9T0_9PEZI